MELLREATKPLFPPIQLDRLRLDDRRTIFVVRDDLLPAGSKQRAILPLLQNLKTQGTHALTYASPFAGFAQVALAYGSRELKMPCNLFCERDPAQSGLQPHAFTRLAEKYGAKISLADSLEEAESRSSAFSSEQSALKIPLGFHCKEFQQHFQLAITDALASIRRQLGALPKRAWLPVGSGTLAQAFYQVVPPAMHLSCVDVHVLPETDPRIDLVKRLPGITYYSAREKFHEPARRWPPLPSNIHYDAKLWPFLWEQAQDGDLWWNVAR